MGWNYLSIPKLQRFHRWSLGIDKYFHSALYKVCNYISMLGLQFIYVYKRAPGRHALSRSPRMNSQPCRCAIQSETQSQRQLLLSIVVGIFKAYHTPSGKRYVDQHNSSASQQLWTISRGILRLKLCVRIIVNLPVENERQQAKFSGILTIVSLNLLEETFL